MKNLKKCFGLAGGRKSGLSFATFAICAIILFAVPLQISCSDSGDDNGDSTVGATLRGGAFYAPILRFFGKKQICSVFATL